MLHVLRLLGELLEDGRGGDKTNIDREKRERERDEYHDVKKLASA